MSYSLIKYYFEMGVYSVLEVATYVDSGDITEEDFHMITGYSYKGIIEMQNKNG